MEHEPAFIAKQLPYAARRITLRAGEMAYLDVGEGRPVLLLHGNPTWSFLYRKVIAALRGAPVRIIAPDLIGFGRSEKPRRLAAHSLRMHGESVLELVARLELDGYVLVVQDWGGPIGGWAAAAAPERVAAVLLMNTSLLMPKTFRATAFHRFSHAPLVSDVVFRLFNFPIPLLGKVQADPASISGEVAKAYAWPFEKLASRAGPLALARMVPDRPDHPTLVELARVDAWLSAFRGPIELLWGIKDPLLGRALRKHRERLRQARVTEVNAGHFLQEEAPLPIADAIRRLVRAADSGRFTSAESPDAPSAPELS